MPNPENLKPPVKGERRNPNGRPKGSRNRSTVVKYWLEAIQEDENPITKKIEKLQVQDLMTLAIISKALNGDVNAYKELMDSAHGKVVNSVDLTSTDGTMSPQKDISKLSTEELMERVKLADKLERGAK